MGNLLEQFMIDLKEYIEESLLDDFDTLNNKAGEAIENYNPWVEFWTKVRDWKSFDEGCKDLMSVLSTEAESTTAGEKVPKGRVLVSLHTDSTHKQTAILIEYNKQDWKSGKMFRGSKPWIFLEGARPTPMSNIIRPRFGTEKTCGRIKLNQKEGYLLNERYSKQAIDMLHKAANGDWLKYVYNL